MITQAKAFAKRHNDLTYCISLLSNGKRSQALLPLGQTISHHVKISNAFGGSTIH
ncbi:hypothetical protein IMCC1989_275 [gamma proteobacterium IMCC1989]|nr:hypothetical protein IMCC1989_275 [gamma proteobacterium IMCC1989]